MTLWGIVISEKVKVVQYGVGDVGLRCMKALLEKEGVEVVGAIDIDPAKVGRDVGELTGIGRQTGVIVSSDADAVLSQTKPDIVVHLTSSYLEKIYPQLVQCISHGANVFSLSEELSYPWLVSSSLANALDELAKRHGVTVVGGGVNPGFINDVLPVILTFFCGKIDKIKMERIQDARPRRKAFQKKIGAGLASVEEFQRAVEERRITKHVGMTQSIALITYALKWNLDKIEELPPEPAIAKQPVESEYFRVKTGQVAGARQFARGIKDGKEVITIDFQAYLGAPESYDAITIEGVPNIYQKISGGWDVETAIVNSIINNIPRVINAPPGLFTVVDLPVPYGAVEDLRKYVKK